MYGIEIKIIIILIIKGLNDIIFFINECYNINMKQFILLKQKIDIINFEYRIIYFLK